MAMESNGQQNQTPQSMSAASLGPGQAPAQAENAAETAQRIGDATFDYVGQLAENAVKVTESLVTNLVKDAESEGENNGFLNVMSDVTHAAGDTTKDTANYLRSTRDAVQDGAKNSEQIRDNAGQGQENADNGYDYYSGLGY